MRVKFLVLLNLLITVQLFSQTLNVLSTTPTQNANTVSTAATVIIEFDHPIDTVGIADQFVIRGSMREQYSFNTTVNPSLQTVQINTINQFILGEIISVTIRPTLCGINGEFFSGLSWLFSIKPTLQTQPYFNQPEIYGSYVSFNIIPHNIDEDEDVDLIISDLVKTQILKNDGTGHFSLFQNLPGGGSVAMTDIDLDFRRDLIISDDVYEQASDGYFYYDPTLEWGNWDMNRDGYPDRVISDLLTWDDTLTFMGICYNNGNGQMGDPDTLLVDTYIRGFASNDFNNDGINDVAYFTMIFATPTGVGGNNSLRIVYMDSNGDTLYRNIYNEVDFPYGELGMPFSIQSADFNNDGYADILLMTNVEDYIVFNDTQGGFILSNVQIVGGGDLYHVAKIGDINADGWLDLVYNYVIGYFENASTSYLINNNGVFSNSALIYEEEMNDVHISALADLNGDGALDIASTWYTGLYIHFNSEYNPIIKEEEVKASKFYIIGNYPNPFNNETTVQLYLPTPGMIKSKIYDITGKEVKYFNSRLLNAGLNKLKWDGKNNFGKEVSSGTYFWEFNHQGVRQYLKIILFR